MRLCSNESILLAVLCKHGHTGDERILLAVLCKHGQTGDWAQDLPHAERMWYDYTMCPFQTVWVADSLCLTKNACVFGRFLVAVTASFQIISVKSSCNPVATQQWFHLLLARQARKVQKHSFWGKQMESDFKFTAALWVRPLASVPFRGFAEGESQGCSPAKATQFTTFLTAAFFITATLFDPCLCLSFLSLVPGFLQSLLLLFLKFCI